MPLVPLDVTRVVHGVQPNGEPSPLCCRSAGLPVCRSAGAAGLIGEGSPYGWFQPCVPYVHPTILTLSCPDLSLLPALFIHRCSLLRVTNTYGYPQPTLIVVGCNHHGEASPL